MSFDRRITALRSDLADERLGGQVEAERFTTGTLMRINATSAPVHRQPSPESPRDTEELMGDLGTVYDDPEGWAWGHPPGDAYVAFLQSALWDAPGADPTHKVSAVRTFVYA